MQVVLALDPGDSRSLQRQLFDQIRDLILERKLRCGDPVPPSRALSEQLGVSRNTVILAYEHLLSEGYIESRPNVGTFVSSNLPETVIIGGLGEKAVADQTKHLNGSSLGISRKTVDVQSVISPNRGELSCDFWVGRGDPAAFPAKEWRRIMDAKVRHGGSRLVEYQDPQGIPELREAIAEHIGPARGVAANADQVVIVNGSQDGLTLIARMLSSTARCFLHEDPSYQGACYLFQALGYEMHPIAVDENGINPSKLLDQPQSILYVTPSHQFPLGVTLSLERRLQLLEWANRTDSLIIEDDYDGDFRYEGAPLTALSGLDRSERVLYLGTFSKSLGAGLRLGYIVAPPSIAGKLRDWKALTSNGTAWLEQAAMAEFMNSGGFSRHLRRIRTLYKARRDLLVDRLNSIFPESPIKGRRGGMHVALRLPASFPDAGVLSEAARLRSIGIYTPRSGGAFITPGNRRERDTLLFGYAALSEKNIDVATRDLRDIVNSFKAAT